MQEAEFEEEVEEENDGFELFEGKNFQESGKYWKEIKKIIETCDIILEILDARDPLSCRCKYIERKILSMADKKIVLVLNKIDLIPMENAYAWQTYLRREFPVVMFKANLQSQGTHLSSFNLFKKSIADSTDMADSLIHSTKAIGTDHLIQLIKQISKVEGSNRAVTVGLIGYPNVGKSSVINSLKRNKACEVSSIPGCTKALQEVKLDSQVKLLDCPGVIFEKNLTRNQLILQNTAKYDEALEEVIEAIIERISMKELTEYYKIEPFSSTVDFLAKICRAHGKLGKGGVPEMKQGAKLVVEDWNKGNLKYFSIPPFQEERERAQQVMLE